jgi:hypothetical protein
MGTEGPVPADASISMSQSLALQRNSFFLLFLLGGEGAEKIGGEASACDPKPTTQKIN